MNRNIYYSILLLVLFSVKSNAQIFTENFESGIPNTWAIFDNGVGTAVSWGAVPYPNPNTAAQILFDCSVASDAEDWLVTPLITPTATDNFLRFFQADPDGTDYGSVMTIRVSTLSQTTAADFTTIYTQGESAVPIILAPHQVDLSAYIGQPIYIAFVMTQNCGDRWVIDDVEVRSECDNIDLTISAAENTLTANHAGATYEWIACTGTPITGETNQSITVTDVLQLLRVKITTSNGCSETTGCYTVAALSIVDNDFKAALSLYPNPINNTFQIKNLSQQVSLSIYDISGKEFVKVSNYTGGEIDVSNLNRGVYLVKINTDFNEQVLKLLK